MGKSKGTRNKAFTEDEINKLKVNAHVRSVTERTIHFTEDFKRLFYERRKMGVPSQQIFRDCGIDPEVLGQNRMEGFSSMLNKQARRSTGFEDLRFTKLKQETAKQESIEERIKFLEHELTYTRQEVEFLKKLRVADLEVMKQSESKHRQK